MAALISYYDITVERVVTIYHFFQLLSSSTYSPVMLNAHWQLRVPQNTYGMTDINSITLSIL